MTDIYKWSTTPATNATADSAINMAEFMNPDLVNDGIRQLMARVAEWRRDLGATLTTGGTANAYTLTTNSAITAYVDGFTIWFTADRANGGSATLSINGLAAVPLRAKTATSLPANSMLAGGVYGAMYKAATSEFILVGSNAGLSELAPSLLSAHVFGLKVGSPTLSLSASPEAGFIRLTETTQAISKTDYPELNTVVSGWGYPWGSASTTFNLPPAAGYFLRFAATSTAIDTSGPRTAGSTQADQNKSHSHTAGSLVADINGAHTHTYLYGTVEGSLGVQNTTLPQWNTTTQTQPSGAHTHTISGSTASDGGNEVRVKNVALHLDILAKPALVSMDLIGLVGYAYKFSTATADADPGAGFVALNSASANSATTIYICETDYWAVNIATVILSWDDVGTSARGRLRFTKVGTPGTYLEYSINGAITDAGSYAKIPVQFIGSNGTFSSSDKLHIQFSSTGEQGAMGPNGSDGGIRWTWDTATTMADPGAGKFRLNNATIGSATAFAISASTGETGNPSAAGWVRTWDDSTTTARRGTLTLRKSSGTQNFIILDVTSAITDNSTWLTGSCSVRDTAGSFSASDVVLVSFSPAGDKGLDGAGSGTVTGITAGAGLSSSGVGSTGGTVSVSGTLTSVEAVNAQTGTSYTVVSGDHAKLVTISNTSSVAVTLPQATSSFGAGFFFDLANINSGVVTITPTTSTINGAASLTLNRFLSVRIVSDGTNWHALHGSSFRSNTITVASATTCDIGATASQRISITGTTTITGFGTVPNQIRFVTFTGALTLTHNATSLILPGGASITTAAGDSFIAGSDSSGNWRVIAYTKADGTAVVGGSGGGSPSIPQGRITLSTATPLINSTISAATTVYYTPYTGRYVPLYNGSTWTMTDIGGELSQATTDSTKSPAAVAANSNYDLFVWSDSGTYRFTRGPAWSSDTARGTGAGTTELERVNGILVNKVAITNGPAAQRGTYVGTIRSNGSSQIDFQYGAISANGTAGIIGVWNAYNRVSCAMVVGDSTDTWAYTTATIRAANGSPTMRVSAICGEAGSHLFEAAYSAQFTTTASGARAGVGYDSTSVLDGAIGMFAPNAGDVLSVIGSHAVPAGLGWHFFSANERGNTGCTMYGDNGSPGTQQSALIVTTMY
jgi:hypothetical protein